MQKENKPRIFTVSTGDSFAPSESLAPPEAGGAGAGRGEIYNVKDTSLL